MLEPGIALDAVLGRLAHASRNARRLQTLHQHERLVGPRLLAEQRVQRRLAAILAADVVGYSRMMREDEAGTLVRLQTLRRELLHPKVEEFGGRIVKTTGDGTLIEFPSAVDAVSHAVDVQRAMSPRNADLPKQRRMVLRIGINIGDVQWAAGGLTVALQKRLEHALGSDDANRLVSAEPLVTLWAETVLPEEVPVWERAVAVSH